MSFKIVGTYNGNINDLQFIKNIGYDTVFYTKNNQLTEYAGYLDVPIHYGHEHPGYLKYIIDNYNDLPDRTLFCHCHETSWHQSKPLQNTVNDIKSILFDIDYLNITDVYPGYNFVIFDELESNDSIAVTCDSSNYIETLKKYKLLLNIKTEDKYYMNRIQTIHILGKDHCKYYKELFPNTVIPKYLLTKYSPQPVISKDLLLQKPKIYYEVLYNTLRDIRHNYPDNHHDHCSRYKVSYFWEMMLPYIITSYNNEIDYYIEKNMEIYI